MNLYSSKMQSINTSSIQVHFYFIVIIDPPSYLKGRRLAVGHRVAACLGHRYLAAEFA